MLLNTRMTNREKILQSIHYVEANLKSDIDVSVIAKEACCSLYHFIRLFKSIADTSPRKYLLKRRLAESIAELRNSEKKISTIAYEYQFSSNEVFTRAFKKQFGISPSKVRKGTVVPGHLMAKRISQDFIFQSSKARNQSPELVELTEKIIVGSSYFIAGNLTNLDLSRHWSSFLKMMESIGNKVAPTNLYQVQFWSENQIVEGMHFFIGVEVTSIKGVLPELVIKIIPKGKYLKFIHKGLAKNVGYTYRYIYNEYLPDTDYQLTEPFNFEQYGVGYESAHDDDSESHIFIPIK